MKVPGDGQVQCRVRITGTYRGRPFVYVDPEDSKGSQFVWDGEDPSRFWRAEGNMSCDCNRSEFLPPEWGVERFICGKEIMIDRIEPLDYDGPVLELNETILGRQT